MNHGDRGARDPMEMDDGEEDEEDDDGGEDEDEGRSADGFDDGGGGGGGGWEDGWYEFFRGGGDDALDADMPRGMFARRGMGPPGGGAMEDEFSALMGAFNPAEGGLGGGGLQIPIDASLLSGPGGLNGQV